MAIIDQIQVNETTYDIRDKSAQPKESGKGLSANDFTDAYKNQLDSLSTELDTLQPKESGKGLSTNDFTNSYKDILDQIFIVKIHATQGSEVGDAIAANKLVLAVDAQEQIYVYSRAYTVSNNTYYEFTRINNNQIIYYTVKNASSNSNWVSSSSRVLFASSLSTPQPSKVAVTTTGGLIDFYDIDDTPTDNANAFVRSKGISGALAQYVKRVAGKGLSTNDFTYEYKGQLDGLADDLAVLQPKESGKGLSTNDFTDAYKDQLDNLSDELNGLQPKISGKGLSTNDFTNADKAKLDSYDPYEFQSLSNQITALQILISSMQIETVPDPAVVNDVLYFFGDQANVDQNDYLVVPAAQVSNDYLEI